ncbi:cytochrome c-type biogenesis protein CycK (plasmid) [Ruegeria pomeroyi DSS-3]|uniref:Cytochrome c-type biogenesis protein CycK n=2 Tax=Ruegeria pomeroyi TaxID=89184 RepID=Q5LL31_RUEPO|nr:heme lyase CcmF/NrfE family subunit [Ruegeria pomeroyi]AAV97332.1 cytochrome c-type biogenesis protein CycK [Ruegeria pomeroyi DSS-3]NVK96803.1 heme lyase CcmF/NrfE family subunit [Ruegeria pomeroyi]NVL00021.1 heme lyase CcmF/NrfE family subunit [Ruegeria pomeroyi]HCE71347.1 heme lyase CcmF/NrfE family subunit [Ruegeria sp.]
MIETSIELGQFAVSLALILSVFGCFQAVLAARSGAASRLVSARNAIFANFVLATIGCAVLIQAFVTSDFSVAYVAQNSNRDLPMLYKVTAMWGAHEGSLLLWLWYLTLFSAAAVWLHWRDYPKSMPWVIATLAAIQLGFLAFVVFLSNPFLTLTPMPGNGRDLNPLLQDPGLAFHPPVLYLGYVGFAVPFAFAIASLIRGQTGVEWVTVVRRWVLFAWTALTSGIICGGYWAYYELGWGGYWAWDPVENASLMPWLTGTALLHSMMVQDKRGMFRAWNVFLVVTTFLLTLLGTFLVRSGVLTSVHAFAVDPGRGAYMLGFMTVAMVVGYGLIILRADRLQDDGGISSLLSREAAILGNTVLLLVVTATVMAGTLFPLVVEVFSDAKISIGAPYYNKVIVPIMVALVFLLGLGPSVPWRQMSAKRFVGRFRLPLAFAGLTAVAAVLVSEAGIITLAAIFAVGFAGFASLADIASAIAARRRVMEQGVLRATGDVLTHSRQRIGALIIHFGVVMIGAGMIASGLFQTTQTVAMRIGDRAEAGGYTLTLRELQDTGSANYNARVARFSISRDGELLFEMAPEKRFYPVREMATTEIAIRSSLAGDLYMVMGDEDGQGTVVVRIFWNPLVNWIWLGWLVLLLGALLSLSKPSRRAARSRTPEPIEGVPAE